MKISKKETAQHLSVLFLLTITVLIIYSNTFNTGFYYDDLGNIVKNKSIKDLGHLFDIIKGQRPVGMLTFALNYHINGLNPPGYHAVSLIIHILTSFLIYLLIDLTIKNYVYMAAGTLPVKNLWKVPLFTSLIFAVHPVQTQAVTYIVQRTEILASLYMVLAVTLFAVKDLAKSKLSYSLYVAGIYVSYFFGYHTKEIAITIPALILFYDIFFLSRFRFSYIFSKKWFYITLFGMALFFTVTKLTSFQNTPDGSAGFVLESITAKEYFFTQFNVIVTYIRLLLFPFNQNLDYDYPIARTIFELPTFFSFFLLNLIIALLIFALIIFYKNSKVKVIVFFVFWFFITLFPTSSFIPILDVIYEHRLYLPLLSFAVILPFMFFGISEAPSGTPSLKKRVPHVYTLIFLILIILFSVKTYERNAVWKTGVSLWMDVSLKSPNKARSNSNLGNAYMDVKDYDKAIVWLKKAINSDRLYVEPHYNLGLCYIKKGEYKKALPEFEEVIRINKVLGSGHFGVARDLQLDLMSHANLGNLYNLKNEYTKAIYHYKEAVKLDPENISTLYNMAITYKKTGNDEEAIKNFKDILRIDPRDKGAMANLNQLLEGRYQY